MIHVFRHADAGRRDHWEGPDGERPLSRRGRREAELVAERLAAAGVARILTSPNVRCVQSVEPLSLLTGVAIEREDSLREATPADRVDALLASLEAGTVLCSHGDIISGLIGRVAAGGAGLEGGLQWQKGSVWDLETGPGGRIRSGRYVPPPITDG